MWWTLCADWCCGRAQLQRPRGPHALSLHSASIPSAGHLRRCHRRCAARPAGGARLRLGHGAGGGSQRRPGRHGSVAGEGRRWVGTCMWGGGCGLRCGCAGRPAAAAKDAQDAMAALLGRGGGGWGWGLQSGQGGVIAWSPGGGIQHPAAGGCQCRTGCDAMGALLGREGRGRGG